MHTLTSHLAVEPRPRAARDRGWWDRRSEGAAAAKARPAPASSWNVLAPWPT